MRRRLGHPATITVLALLTPCLPASAQQRAPAQPAASAAAQAAGPSFQSGGLKATVTSIAAQRQQCLALPADREQDAGEFAGFGDRAAARNQWRQRVRSRGSRRDFLLHLQPAKHAPAPAGAHLRNQRMSERRKATAHARHLYADRCRQRRSDECRLHGVICHGRLGEGFFVLDECRGVQGERGQFAIPTIPSEQSRKSRSCRSRFATSASGYRPFR